MKTMKQTDSKANTSHSIRKHTSTARKHIDNLTQSGHVITLLNDYSSSATGEYITLDFSNTAVFSPAIAEEAVAVIRSMYEAEYYGAAGFFRNYPLDIPFEYISFAANKSLLQRPYIVRLTILSLLFVPSTNPFDNGLATEFSTAARSFSNPIEKRESSFKVDFLYFSMKRYNRGILLR